MIDFLFFALLLVAYLDIRLLKNEDGALFLRAFSVSTVSRLVFVICAALVLASADGYDVFPYYVLFVFLSFYLFLRKRYVNEHAFWTDASNKSTAAFIADAYGVIMIWFWAMLVFALCLKILLKYIWAYDNELFEVIVNTVVSSAFGLFFISRAAKRFGEKNFYVNVDLINHRNNVFRQFIVPVVLGVAFAFLSSLVIVYRQFAPQTPLSDILETADSVAVILIFLFLAIIMAPFVEEVVFRGYFFKVIKRFKGEAVAIHSIALIFGLLHAGQYWGDWAAIGLIVVLGYVLTLLRAKTNTTLSSMVMHYAYNSAVTVIPAVMLAASNPAYFKYQAYYDTFDTETKIGLLEESIKTNPKLADAYYELAVLYEKEDDKTRALEMIEYALRLNPSYKKYLEFRQELK